MKRVSTFLTIYLLLAIGLELSEARTADGSYLCEDGRWTGQKCKPCHSSGCTTCDENFYESKCPATQSKSYGITGCEQGCLSSGTKTQVCTQCWDNWYTKDSGLCLKCPTDCTTCSGKSSCTECDDNFFLLDGQCVAPTSLSTPSKCAQWASKTTCKQCVAEYFLKSETSCLGCPTNCSACTDEKTCTTCQSNYFLNAGQCDLCNIANCSECVIDASGQQCNKCYSSFYLQDNKCNPKGNCEIEDSTDPTQCQVCKDGYSLVATTKLCDACTATGVLRCSDDKQDILQCKPGYALMKTGTNAAAQCVLLTGTEHEWCQQHESASICKVCYSEYILSSGKCILCSANDGCLQCSPGTGTTAHTCSECQEGYYLPSATAQQCNLCNGNSNGIGGKQLACKCDTTGKCTACMEGYYQKPASPSVTCESCSDTNCSSCDPENPHICRSCKIGNYLEYSDGNTGQQNRCMSCGSNCVECIHGWNCNKCNTWSRLDPETKSCIATGVKLSDGINALQCQAGYTLQGGLCKICFIDGVSKCPTTCTDTAASGGGGATDGGNSNLYTIFMLAIITMILTL